MTGPAESNIRVRGTLAVADGIGTVRIELDVPAAITEVWAAVTEPERLRGWLGEIRGDLREGGTWTALLFPSGWDGEGRVLECEPGHRWSVEGAEPGHPMSRNELELTATGSGGTRVVLTQHGMAAAHVALHGVGVQIHVENLAAYLRGETPVDPDPYWVALQPRYEELAAAL